MAATELFGRWLRAVARLLPALAAGPAIAVDLPPDRAEALYHLYDGGGVKADGPALLVRKSMAGRVSLSAQYYVDAVSNASIDVVTTASPYREQRTAVDLGLDYVVGDATIKFGYAISNEPDYEVDGFSIDLTQEVYGGMTTVSVGFGRSSDLVGRKDIGFFDSTRHWQYRAGVTQILSTRWLASLNVEAISDNGYLGNPYRVARVFDAAVPERHPRTRSSRALRLSTAYDLDGGQAVNGGYRYYFDTWDIKAHTFDVGYSRRFGERWLGDTFVRSYSQSAALFYSDNATTETQYVSRNRQLSTYNTLTLGLKGTYALRRAADGAWALNLHGGYEYMRFAYKDFTDLRTGSLYGFDAHILQLYASATF